jgi:hypothetical protein
MKKPKRKVGTSKAKVATRKAGKRHVPSKAATLRHRKKKRWCNACLPKKVEAVKYRNGNRDTYCREHKRGYMKAYMQRRRADDPTYGQG